MDRSSKASAYLNCTARLKLRALEQGSPGGSYIRPTQDQLAYQPQMMRERSSRIL